MWKVLGKIGVCAVSILTVRALPTQIRSDQRRLGKKRPATRSS